MNTENIAALLKDIINNLVFSEGRLEGNLQWPESTAPLKVALDPDSDHASEEDYRNMAQGLQSFLAAATAEAALHIREQVSKEVTDAAFSQGLYDPTHEDYDQLLYDLRLTNIVFFPEELVMTYVAATVYPGNEISVQLSYDMKIEDISVL
jgi:hypothetical protein